MKKRAIFLMMLVVLFAFAVTSLTKVNAATTEGTYTAETSNLTLDANLLAEGKVVGTTGYNGYVKLTLNEPILIKDDAELCNKYLNFKANFQNIYRVNLYILTTENPDRSESSGRCVKWWAASADQTDNRLVQKMDENGNFLYRGDLSEAKEWPVSLVGKTVIGFQFQLYTVNSGTGEFQILGLGFDGDKTFNDFREVYDPNAGKDMIEYPVAPGDVAYKNAPTIIASPTPAAEANTVFPFFQVHFEKAVDLTSASYLAVQVKFRSGDNPGIQYGVIGTDGAWHRVNWGVDQKPYYVANEKGGLTEVNVLNGHLSVGDADLVLIPISYLLADNGTATKEAISSFFMITDGFFNYNYEFKLGEIGYYTGELTENNYTKIVDGVTKSNYYSDKHTVSFPSVVLGDFVAGDGAEAVVGVNNKFTTTANRINLTSKLATPVTVENNTYVAVAFEATPDVYNFNFIVTATKEDGTSGEVTAYDISATSSSTVLSSRDGNVQLLVFKLSGISSYNIITDVKFYFRSNKSSGDTIEILNCSISQDLNRGFTGPMLKSDIIKSDTISVEKNENNETVLSYTGKTGYNPVKYYVTDIAEKYDIVEIIFTTNKATGICFSFNGIYDTALDHYIYAAEETHKFTANLADYPSAQDLELLIYVDAKNPAAEGENTLVINSIKLKSSSTPALDFSVADKTVDYTGSPVELDVTCAEDVEFKYEYAVAGTTDWVAGTPTNAGSYVVKVSYVGDAFLETSKEVNVVINKVKAEAPALEDVTVDPNTRIVTIHKAGIEVYLESADGVEVYDGDEISYGETLFYRYAGDENHEPSDFVEFTFVKPHVHTFEEGWTHDETHHWHAASCAHTEEVDGKAEHEYNVPGHGNGYTWMECLCGRVDETTKEAHATYLHTYNPGDGTRTDNLKATLNEDGTYSFEMTTPKWGRFVLYYNGVAIASDQVTMLTGTAWVDGTYTGGYPFYNDAESGDKTTFISAIGGDYTVKYNPTENTLLLGEYVEPLPEGAHKVAVNNADAGGNQIAVFVTAGDVIRNNSGAYPHHPGQWDPYRLFIVIDSKGRVAYMCLMPIKGYGNPYEGSYARHSVYANYRENPAFGNLSDEYAGQWGTTVDWSLIVPEGGYVISAHGDAATAIGKEILNNPDFVGTDNYENMVNSKTINVDSITVTYNAEKNYLLVKSHEHVASTEWEKDGSNHWHICTVCELEMEKAEHSWGDGEVTEAPSHTEVGVRTFTCSCGETKTAEEPAVGHSHSTEWSKDATHHWHECSCGDKADKAEHTYGEGVVTKEPTTEAKGEKTFTCSCGHSYTEEIATLEPAPQPQPAQKGCGGSVIASIFGVLALAGSVVVLRKKREE